MARVPQVTRTIQTTVATVMCLNIVDGTSFTQEVTLSRTYKDNDTILKCVRGVIDTEEVKAVHIVSTRIEEVRYGMTEQRFIQLADVIPPLPKYESKSESENN